MKRQLDWEYTDNSETIIREGHRIICLITGSTSIYVTKLLIDTMKKQKYVLDLSMGLIAVRRHGANSCVMAISLPSFCKGARQYTEDLIRKMGTLSR